MDREQKIDEYIARMIASKPRPGYENSDAFRDKQKKDSAEKLIQDKGLKAGREVNLRLLGMKGVIETVKEPFHDLPIVVKREDGQIFSYTPEEVDPV